MSRVRSGVLYAFFLLLISVSRAAAHPVSPREGLEALRKSFAGISDFSAEITQEKKLALLKRTMVMTGTVRFRKPDLFLLELNHPYAGRMLLRDTVIEQSSGKGGEISRMTLPPDQGLKQWFGKLAAPVARLPDGVVIKADLNDGVYSLVITPQSKGQVKELQLVFTEQNGIQRVMITEQNGDRATMNFRRMRRNSGLADKDFRLE